MKIADPSVTDTAPARIELPPANPPAKQPGENVTLADLERELQVLEAGFAELEKLKGIVHEAEKAFEQVCQEEKQLLANGELKEKTAVEKLIEIRSRRDWRFCRLSEARTKVELQADLLVHDVGEPLRNKFRRCAHQLYIAKEREMIELIGGLWPNGGGLPVTSQQLLQAALPLITYRQLSNWTAIEFRKISPNI